jgi:hypothetical protein
MTALAIARRRFALGLAGLRLEFVAGAAVLIVLVLAATFAVSAPQNEATTTTTTGLQVTGAKAAQMVAATSASPQQLRATGEEAKLINAQLPFNAGPILAVPPFAVRDDGLDRNRALLCLTQAVYYEAGFEPLQGRRAVAQVVLNRMRHPAFPKSVCGVVYQGSRSPVCQFSFACDGSLNRAPAMGAWNEARTIAAAALAGFVEASVGSATHYHADYVAPYWAPKLTKLAKLGAHIFYRWPGAWGQPAAFTGRYTGEPYDPAALRAAPSPADGPVQAGSEAAIVVAEAGPPIARAPNDVGGLLDTSKGWKLNIPMPVDVSSATARALAEQQTKDANSAPAATTAAAAAAAPVIAGR